MDDFKPLDTKKMTHSALERFAIAVDMVMQAEGLCAEERRDLVTWWAYQYKSPKMLENLAEAIKRCQSGDVVRIRPNVMIDWITGEPTLCNSGDFF